MPYAKGIPVFKKAAADGQPNGVSTNGHFREYRGWLFFKIRLSFNEQL